MKEEALEQGGSYIIVVMCNTVMVFFSSELMISDRQAKAEILRLEEELPSWRTVIETGSGPGKYKVSCLEQY